MKRCMLFLLVFVPLLGCSQLTGRVVSIADGDSFTMLVNEKQIKIRLHGIDCPEKGQAYSKVAKEFLAGMIAGKNVTVKNTDTDRYRRTVGVVYVDGVNVNEALLKAGLAWHYKEYDKNTEWAELENKAREDKRGLWVMKNPVAPWDYRKNKRK